ncbi:hypothetical protein TWF696_007572 [Orbilia brochopaga]|uniref:Uncharacterized protein n=1 Tax=Orbilia brochopaga TaxID=3140254 RepID=A0AAV9UM48_9PEZI
MIRRSWSIRIEAPKPPPPPPPRSAASKVAHWAGIPHYRLPRFDLADEAMLSELQTEEFDDEDYSLLPSRSSTVSKPRHEVRLVNVPDRQGFTDRPKPEGGKLRKTRPSKSSSHRTTKASHVPDPISSPIAAEEAKPDDPRIIPGDVHADKSVPADFDSSSTDYPRHPRTPDRYMPSLSRGPSQRERRTNSLSSTSDRGGDHSFNDSVKAPIAVRKSPPQFLQHWDDSNPYYYSRYHEPEHTYTNRSRPTNRSLSISSAGRLPILHESHHEFSGDDIAGMRMSRAQTMPSGIQTQPRDESPRQRRISRFAVEAERNEPSTSFLSHHDSSRTLSSQGPMRTPSAALHRTAAPFSPDETALTEMSTEILIAGERMEKRPHLPPTKTIEEWVKRVGTPPDPSGTPKTILSNEVEVDEDETPKKREKSDVDAVWQTSPLTTENADPEIPIPVPTRTPPQVPSISLPQPERPIMSPTPPPKPDPIATVSPVEVSNSPEKWPTVEEIRSAEPPVSEFGIRAASPVTPFPAPPTEPPPPPPPPKAESGPTLTFTIDPRAAEKRRMTVAFGITPLQRRETAELAQDVMRRVSSVGIRRGNLARVIRVVDTMLVQEREEQLRRARRVEMAWD